MNEQQRQAQLPPRQLGGEVDERETLAQEIAVEPSQIQRRLDIAQVLNGMRRGVLVELTITRPRFTVAIAKKKQSVIEISGLEKLGLILSEEAQRVLYDYFSLGRHSLLPRQWQEELNVAETAARRCLAEHSIKTHWGAFVPASAYKRWQDANEIYKERFMALKERIVAEYDEMRATVEADYRRLAEDAWSHAVFGRVALQAHDGEVTSAMVTDLSTKLREQETHDQFITQYMNEIESKIPTREELEDSFEYDHDISYIPLPSHLTASESHEPGRSQFLQEASTQAELEVIEARRQADLQALENETRMHEDVIRHAQEQKERLVSDFYARVVEHINTRIAEVCRKTRESIQKNGNALRGPNAESLRDLLTMMQSLNIVGDQHIEEQIAKLREALPIRWSERGKGAARIDTSRIEAVVREMEEDAEQVLIELDLTDAPRGRRAQPLTLGEDLIADTPRRSARSKPSVLPVNLAVGRRSRGKAKQS
jgi:hypothetical protein